jgi:uncharacterized protein (UPF0218 family)
LTPVLSLPERLRSELKDPLGPVVTDAETLLAAVEGPLVTVGDIVTYHLEEVGRPPDVALFDARTKREPVDDTVGAALAEADVRVENPAGTITKDLLVALRDAVDASDPVRIRVDGEEDLAALPAIIAAPEGASVVYGQPDDGMVHVCVTADTHERARDLIARMDGDPEAALGVLAG